MIIVSQGGIGRPIDRDRDEPRLFEKFDVEVVGAVINKVDPAKLDLIPFLEQGLARLGLPLLGAIPFNHELRKPTLNQVCQQLDGRFLAGAEHKRRRVGKVVIGAMSSYQLDKYLEPQSLLIVSGDREDMILTATQAHRSGKRPNLAGVVLVDGALPSPGVLRFCASTTSPTSPALRQLLPPQPDHPDDREDRGGRQREDLPHPGARRDPREHRPDRRGGTGGLGRGRARRPRGTLW